MSLMHAFIGLSAYLSVCLCVTCLFHFTMDLYLIQNNGMERNYPFYVTLSVYKLPRVEPHRHKFCEFSLGVHLQPLYPRLRL